MRPGKRAIGGCAPRDTSTAFHGPSGPNAPVDHTACLGSAAARADGRRLRRARPRARGSWAEEDKLVESIIVDALSYYVLGRWNERNAQQKEQQLG
jgi:hypothetical protein